MRKFIYGMMVVFVLFMTGCADAGKDQSVVSGDVVTLNGSASKADFFGEIKKYRWKQVKGSKVALSDIKAVKPTFTAPSVSQKITLIFHLVTKEMGGYYSPWKTKDQVTIIVNPISTENKLPQAIASVNSKTIKYGESVTFDANTSTDSDGEIISYKWTDVQGNVLSNMISFTHIFTTSGEHNITLSVMDDDEQIGTSTVSITVEALLLSVSLSSTVSSLEVNQTTELNATAHYNDNTTVPVSSSAEWVVGDTSILTIDANGTLKALQAGTTSIMAKVGDVESNVISIEVIPQDTTAPTLTLNGEANLTLLLGSAYTELGASATDDRDANVSVTISGNIDSSTLGSYIVTCTATDTAGNSATAQRTVNVVLPPDTEAPIITLNGEANIPLTQGESYEELGATASDERDGDVNVTIEGSVDTSVEGTYTMTYTATDKAGNETYVTRTVTVVAPTLTSLSLESNVTSLNVGEAAELTLMGEYSDGSTSELDANIEYIITPTDSADINGTVLTAKKDGNVTVQVKVGTTLSNTLNLTIAWVVNGHVLPPEPDPTVNNSTLLGIDSNNNGVRDDVERWIYEEYKDKHPIHIDIAMQAGRAYKLVLESPERAKEIYPIIDAPLYCKMYYTRCSEGKNYNFIENMDSRYFRKNIYFNSIARKDIYAQYDKLLSGDSYTLIRCSRQKQLCDFNTTKYEK